MRARVFYVLHSKSRVPAVLPEGSCLEATKATVTPYAEPFFPLQAELGEPVDELAGFLAELASRRVAARWLVHGQGSLQEVLAASSRLFDALHDESAWVNDLLAARFLHSSVARGLPASFASWSRLEHHVSLARCEGGLVTRGLAKFGHDELAVACEPELERAAAFVLRAVAREVGLSGEPLPHGGRRAIGDLAVVARPGARREAHERHQRELVSRLAGSGYEPVALVELALLDASGRENTAAVLRSLPPASLPELAKPPAPVLLEQLEPPEPEERARPGPAPKLVTVALAPPSWPALGKKSRAAPDVGALFRTRGGALAGPWGKLSVEVERAGLVAVPSGRVIACDLLRGTEVEPLPVEVPPAIYPVYVSIGRVERAEGPRVAAAALLFSEEPPARWERSFVFGVDSGTAGFCDADLATAIAVDDEPDNPLWNKLTRTLDRKPVACARVKVGEDLAGEVTLFRTGVGDGVYVSYIGRDASGTPCAIVFGFGLLEGDAPRQGDQDVEDVRRAAAEAERDREEARRRPIVALETFAMALDVELRTKGDMSEVARLLDSRVVLELAGKKTRGRDAVLDALRALPDELLLAKVETPVPDRAEAGFSWKRDGRPAGTVRIAVTKTGRIRSLSL